MRSDTYVDWATTISANWGGSSVLDALLKKLLVIPYQQIADVVRHGETITSSGLEPQMRRMRAPQKGHEHGRQRASRHSLSADCDPAAPFLSVGELCRRGHPLGRKAAGSALAEGHHGEPTMWAAFVRQFAAYAITRRGKKLFALIGVLALCFGAALLIDMRFYVSASFVGLLAGFSAVAYVVQHVKIKRAEHQRLLRKAEVARQRALIAQARLDRIDTAKSAMRGAVADAAHLVAHNVSVVANEALMVAKETVESVERAVRTAAGAGETIRHANVVQTVRSWWSLKA